LEAPVGDVVVRERLAELSVVTFGAAEAGGWPDEDDDDAAAAAGVVGFEASGAAVVFGGIGRAAKAAGTAGRGLGLPKLKRPRQEKVSLRLLDLCYEQ
jgi:uncharacterized protein with LGFP repeats